MSDKILPGIAIKLYLYDDFYSKTMYNEGLDKADQKMILFYCGVKRSPSSVGWYTSTYRSWFPSVDHSSCRFR